MTTPHKHATVIHAFADGGQVQSRDPKAVEPKWTDCRYPDFDEQIEYRIKPAAPVVESNMTDAQLNALYAPAAVCIDGLRIVADATIARAIADGQVVPEEASAAAVRQAYEDGQKVAYRHESASRTKRDMAVAKCMLDYFNTIQSSVRLHPIDAAVQELIARVN